MAPVAAAVAAWAAKVVVTELVIQALIYTAISFAVSKLLTPKQKSGASKSMEANYYNSEQRVPIIVGYARVGGMEIIPPITTGGDGRFLHRVLGVAGHEVSSYGTIMFDTTTVPQANIKAISQTHSSGYVEQAAFWNDGNPHAWVRCYRGTSTDSMDFLLNYADGVSFDSSFRGRGIAKVMFRYRYNANVYKGVPQHAMYVSGARVYDPRDGGQSATTETTWLWSSNPALIAAWYCVKWGGYDADTEIDWASVEAAADICDESVAIPYSTQRRYTCNGLLFAHTNMQGFQENLELIVESMLGAVVYANGKWSFYAGAWETPTETIPETAWLTPPHVVLEGGTDKRHNRLHCWYVDPQRNWQRVECYPRYNATYAAADGGTLDHEFDQPLCTNEWEAQRKAEMLLRQTRNQILVSGQLGPQYQNLSMNQTVQLDMALLGWEAKTFRVVNFTLNVDGTVNVTVQEEQSTDWTDMAEGDYNIPSAATIPTNETPLPSAPTSLTANQLVSGTIQFTIGSPDHVPRETYYRILSSPYSDGLNAGSYAVLGDASALTMTLSDSYWSTMRYYWAQSLRTDTPGGVYPSTYGLPVFILPPADNTLSNGMVPDVDCAVGTSAYWTWSVDSAHATFDYVPALDGGTNGGLRVTAVASLGSKTDAFIKALPHPNRVSSLGMPASGNKVYQVHVRWRVNSFTALGSYYDNNATFSQSSGGLLIPQIARVSSDGTHNYIGLSDNHRYAYNGVRFFPSMTPGEWVDDTHHIVVPSYVSSTSYRQFDYARLLVRLADSDNSTQIDIDRFIVTDLGAFNQPNGVPTLINSVYGSVAVNHSNYANRVTATVGSVGFEIQQTIYWTIGYSAYVGKVNSSAGNCWLYTQDSSYFLTLAGTTSQVNTITINGRASSDVSIRRVGSWNYIVSGAGLS